MDLLPSFIDDRLGMQILPFDTEMLEYTLNLNEDGDVSGGVLLSYLATFHASGP